jgi:hypothetical protein
MKRSNWLSQALAAAAGLVWSLGASAQALHGFCTGCVDNTIGGVPVTSTTNNPPTNFGFFTAAMGGLTGAYMVDILTPDNGGAAPSGTSYTISGGASGTATLFSTTAWTTKALDAYLGISASPNNPLGAFLPATQTHDPGAMGYWVFDASLGTHALGTSAGSPPVLNLGSSLPAGSVIVAFLNTGTPSAPDWSATANSSALFEDASPAPVPEPGMLVLLTAGLLGLGGSRWRRRTVART